MLAFPCHRRRQAQTRFIVALCGSLTVHAWMAADIRGTRPFVAASISPATMQVRLLRPTIEDHSIRALPLTAFLVPTDVADVRAEKRPETRREASDENGAQSPGRPSIAEPRTLLPQVADSTYYTAQQIDVYPSLLAPLTLDALAASGALAGVALVRLRVDELGRLTHFIVLHAEGASEEALRSAFSAAKFSAARKNGYPVKSEIVVRLLGPPAGTARTELDTAVAVERTQ